MPDPTIFPALFDFPPFFTLQIHGETLERQLTLWSDIICSFFKSQSRLEFEISTDAVKCLPFANAAIQRQLNLESLKRIASHMVQVNRTALWIGSAKKDPKNKSTTTTTTTTNRVLVLWRSLSNWSEDVYTWAVDTGIAAGAGGIETFKALQKGLMDLYHTSPTAQFLQSPNMVQKSSMEDQDVCFPSNLLFAVLTHLQSQGKVEIIYREDYEVPPPDLQPPNLIVEELVSNVEGIKFF